MAPFEAIDALYLEGAAISGHLESTGEPSFQVSYDNQFRKALLLAAASRFEAEVQTAVIAFAAERASDDAALIALVKAKAVERQYHTYFSWEGNNANQFFGLFGAEIKEHAKSVVAADQALASAIKAFLELGHLRNQLVHEDFATFPLDKTPAEIYALYQQASAFVARIPRLLGHKEASGA